MKRVIIIFITMFTCSKISAQVKQEKLRLSFYNNSLLPHKYTLISYAPGETGNGTIGFTLLPQSKKTLSYLPGTKLYLANDSQVDTVMTGKPLTGKPFRVVSVTDAGRVINLNSED